MSWTRESRIYSPFAAEAAALAVIPGIPFGHPEGIHFGHPEGIPFGHPEGIPFGHISGS
jgi:hypothetical protein